MAFNCASLISTLSTYSINSVSLTSAQMILGSLASRQSVVPRQTRGCRTACAKGGLPAVMGYEHLQADLADMALRKAAMQAQIGRRRRSVGLCMPGEASESTTALATMKEKLRELELLCDPDFCPTKGSGPIAVVYPDAVYYHSVTPEVLERIIDQHVVRGLAVTEHLM